jgi:DNA-binding NarL/FixJ family response regulator
MTTRESAVSRGSLVIAGSDPALRRQLCESLTSEPPVPRVAEIAARPGLYQDVAALQPSVILLDVGLTADTDALGMVSALSGLAKVIILADVVDDALTIEALEAGASGVCARSTAPALLRKAVQLVETGEIWIGRRVIPRLIEELTTRRASHRRRRAPGALLSGHPLDC